MKLMNEIDVVGIGFGPSNLATAIALEEAGQNDFLFLEKAASFSWHPNMTLKEANLQNSFLKDLITLRNPRSRFTFLNYLSEKGRIDDFINRRSFFPTRKETTDYMIWAAQFFSEHVSYFSTVQRIFPLGNEKIGIEYKNEKTGSLSTLYCRSLILGIGANPHIPIAVGSHPNRTHTDSMVPWLESHKFSQDTSSSFLIIGGGQSSAEVLYHLLETYPKAKIQVVSRRFIYKSLEESAFINSLFSEKGMNWFSGAVPDAQELLFKDLYEANFSAVDNSLLTKIYELLYEERWQGIDRVRFYPYSEVTTFKEGDGEYFCSIWNRAQEITQELYFDYAIFATGYRYTNVLSLLEPFRTFLEWNTDGIPIRNDDYSLKLSSDFKGAIFAHAIGDKKFGFTEGGMTNLAARAKRIVSRIESMNYCTA